VEAEQLEVDDGACAECGAELPEPEPGRWRRGVLCDDCSQQLEREISRYVEFALECRRT
jgi:hypothetical protein